MDYRDFVIQITEASEDCLRLQVTESPVGESTEIFCGIDSVLARLIEESREGLGRVDAPEGWSSPDALGQRLFEALFTGSVHQRLLEAIGQLGASYRHGLRLQIRATIGSPMAAAAHALPWEFLYRADLGSYLSLDRRFAVVRNLCLPSPRRPIKPSETPRLLIAVASPRGLDPLATEEECKNIAKHWTEGLGLQVDTLTHMTLERLRERLLKREYHGLHLIGHGYFDDLTGDGELFLEDSDGFQAPCSGKDLAIQLADRTSLRWIFLNACSTGCAGTLRPFGGVANALLRTGVSAVLAMQRPISDRSAIVFSSWFYQRLAAGDSIEAACTEGRLAVHRDQPQESEWGTPVLFLRAADGRLLGRPESQGGFEPSLPEPLVDSQVVTAVDDDSRTNSLKLPLLRSIVLLVCVAGLVRLAGTEWGAGTGLPAPVMTQEDSGTSAVESSALTPEILKVGHGQTVRLLPLDAHLTVNFHDVLGETVVRAHLTVRGEPKPIQKTLMGPGSIELGTNDQLRIQGIDWLSREVTVLLER